MQLTLITAAVAAALGFGAAWQWQGRAIDQLNLDSANERIAIQRQSRQALEGHLSRVSEAQAAAAKRSAALAADLDRSRSELTRLRNTSSATVRVVTADPAACPAVTSAYDVVFSQCAGRLVEVAADADRCYSEHKALTDGWPNLSSKLE